MRYGSLYSGIGGGDLGLERAGWKCEWQVEINEFCQRVLQKHWPGVKRWDDVRAFPPEPISDWRVDAIVGGFPCKQTSTAAAIHGLRHGLAGADSGLWFEMLRIVRILRPSRVIVENVGGSATWKDQIAGGLADLGYKVPDEPLALSAEMFGAPHRRIRMFWIADRDGAGLEITRQAGPSAAERIERRTFDGNPWLSSLPGVVRMDDGVPGGLERRNRIERLGNAIVPAMTEWIGRRINDIVENRSERRSI